MTDKVYKQWHAKLERLWNYHSFVILRFQNPNLNNIHCSFVWVRKLYTLSQIQLDSFGWVINFMVCPVIRTSDIWIYPLWGHDDRCQKKWMIDVILSLYKNKKAANCMYTSLRMIVLVGKLYQNCSLINSYHFLQILYSGMKLLKF